MNLDGVAQIVTWLLVAGGWFVVHKMAVRRARRQEELSQVQALEVRLLALRDRAIDYFTTTAGTVGSRKEEALIKYELHSLATALRGLRTHKRGGYDLGSELMNLRRVVTGGDFESATRSARGHSDPLVQEIWVASDTFAAALRVEFEKSNPD